MGVVERIEGFIKTVKKGRLSLLQQLEGALMTWSVKNDDLWPLSGSDALPGLKEVRDKLAHSGPKALHPQSLAVATWHLSILIGASATYVPENSSLRYFSSTASACA